jgi:hypothetical protein
MKTKLLLSTALFCVSFVFGQFGPQRIISTETLKPYKTIPVDIDGDGKIDIAAMGAENYDLVWYRNEDGFGNFGPKRVINQNPIYYISAHFADLDNDGDVDLVYQSNNPSYLGWMENLDGLGNFGPENTIEPLDGVYSFIPVDVDNDGDLDLLCTASDTFTGEITWFENLDGQGSFGPENLLIQNDSEYSKILAADLDNDGLLDVLATDYVLNQGKIFWHKNMGNGTIGPMQIIYQFNWVSGGTNIVYFEYADINTDGKKDIVFTWVDDNANSGTDWLENLDNSGNFGPLQFLSNDWGQYKFHDFDNDGDNDMLLWFYQVDRISWRKNEDGLGSFGPLQTVTTEVEFPRDAAATDLNSDGWLDVVSASVADNKLAWYENRTLGISEYGANAVALYPNPTKGIVFLDSEKPIANTTVYSILGQRITTAFENGEIDLSSLPAGIYCLQIETETGNSQTHKIVKE